MSIQKTVLVCVNHRSNPDLPSCGARGGEQLAQTLEDAINARQLPLRIKRFPCLGECERGPNLKLSPDGEFCYSVKLRDLPDLIDRLAAFAAEE